MHASALAAVAFIATVTACLAAPIARVIFSKRDKTGFALAVARLVGWVRGELVEGDIREAETCRRAAAAGALLVLMMPAPY